jgi:hypothetical protein
MVVAVVISALVGAVVGCVATVCCVAASRTDR